MALDKTILNKRPLLWDSCVDCFDIQRSSYVDFTKHYFHGQPLRKRDKETSHLESFRLKFLSKILSIRVSVFKESRDSFLKFSTYPLESFYAFAQTVSGILLYRHFVSSNKIINAMFSLNCHSAVALSFLSKLTSIFIS